MGGIIGYCNGIRMDNAFNNGVISTTASDAAGIMAYTSDVATLSFCANYGNVSAKAEAAGIVANATKNLELTSSFNAGDITVTNQAAGGLVAMADKPEISRCVNFGSVTNSNASLGSSYAGAAGIVAKANPTVTDCANFGNITAKDNAGSVLAYCKSSYTAYSITNFYNVGKVSSSVDTPKAVNMFVGNGGKVSYTNCLYDNQVLPGNDDANGVTTATLLATDFGDNFTSSDNGYPMPVGLEDYTVSRLHRTALLFSVENDNYNKVSDSFSIKADPEVTFESNDIFTVSADNTVKVKEYTTGDYVLASSLGDSRRLIALHVESGKTEVEDIVGSEIKVIEYFTIDGLRIDSPAPGTGVLIRRTIDNNGNVAVKKVII